MSADLIIHGASCNLSPKPTRMGDPRHPCYQGCPENQVTGGVFAKTSFPMFLEKPIVPCLSKLEKHEQGP